MRMTLALLPLPMNPRAVFRGSMFLLEGEWG